MIRHALTIIGTLGGIVVLFIMLGYVYASTPDVREPDHTISHPTVYVAP